MTTPPPDFFVNLGNMVEKLIYMYSVIPGMVLSLIFGFKVAMAAYSKMAAID